MTHDDPVATNPDHYRVLWENERVRVLDYLDEPGTETTPHDHPDSVLVTLTDFRRRLVSGNTEVDVELAAGRAVWLPAQRHAGINTGDTPTHTILIELKGDSAATDSAAVGPDLK
jgi:hypothetical protein